MRYRCRGELAVHEDGFRVALVGAGYTERCVANQIRVLAHLGYWLQLRGLGAAQLDAERVEEYVAFRREQGHRLYCSARGLLPLLGHLRERGVVPAPIESVDSRPFAAVLSGFRCYLVEERKLKAATAQEYVYYAALFLSGLSSSVAGDLATLMPGDVVAVLRSLCGSRGHSRVKNFTSALRSLLRFLFINGDVPRDLSGSVLPAAGWRRRTLPKALDDADLRALIAGCGSRDRAIVALAVRLGLRAAEVAAVELSDLDWRLGEIRVSGKAGRVDRLPLPADVGEVIVDYLRHERPATSSRSVFITAVAPRKAISSNTVEGVVQRAGRRAGLGPIGPHRLRHTAATQLLRAGASMSDIGQVLRHEHMATTAVYAKVDLAALTPLAMPWPGATA